MSAEENLRRASDMYAAFDRADIDSILDNLADNVTWRYHSSVDTGIPWFGKMTGPAGVAQDFFAAIAENLEIQVFHRTSFVASGDQVAVAYRAEATFKKNGNGYIDEGMHLWRFDSDGKVSEYVGYPDTAAMMKAWND